MDSKKKEAFWNNVNKTESCWIWEGKRDKQGYGYFFRKGQSAKAHRISYELTNGPIPDGLLACHTCDYPSCVNPNHIFIGTQKDNMQDMANKNRAKTGRPRKAGWTDKRIEKLRAQFLKYDI